ncbi:MaoC family dehydratase [Limnohabitans sp. Jir72]|uniref:MaoC family dehydratase n=1 Tax=Limnohabitans sp. Jir72 TaxID=1977909 RepID=UPI000D3DC609|nr:MaoC family dehydratase [Limnohabitans sp. Jir72]PUE33519.1 dehydratase [Limnohabitans sp. Jir72]
MTLPSFDALQVGDAICPLELPPVSRLTLALYCGASGDHNPIHVDTDFAHGAGMPDVIAHGMLSMAWLARLLTNWVPQTAIRDYSVRFAAMTQVGESITCSGQVVEKFELDGERRVRLSLTAMNAQGHIKLSGEAVLAWA